MKTMTQKIPLTWKEIALWTAIVLSFIVGGMLMAGCNVERLEPGDTFSRCVEWNESKPQQIRDGSDLGDEVWAEWWARGAWQPWCRVAFSRAEWNAWHSISIYSDRIEYPPEPHALWVRNSYSSGATGLSAPKGHP